MKITSLVENTSAVGFPVEHGLSLYIQLDNGQNILFDMGQGRLFADNAERLGLSITAVDIAIVSHGHYDHGGGLGTFLTINDRAKVYIHQDAFEAHYSLRDSGLTYIGITPLQFPKGEEMGRVTFCGSKMQIDDTMTLFADVHGGCCQPPGNRLLFMRSTHGESVAADTFTHEQNLIIEEGGKVVLLAGCAHCGIVNIMRKAEVVCGKRLTHVLAGMHLVKSGLSDEAELAFIHDLAKELSAYKGCWYYTMHCTSTEQYQRLKAVMDAATSAAEGGQIAYLSCGESVEI